MCDPMEFAADEVGGESRSKERAIKGRDFLLVKFAAKQAELVVNPLTDERGRVDVGVCFLECGFDVTIRDAAGPQIPRDAVRPLFPVFSAVAEELLRVACVVEKIFAFQSLYGGFHEFFVFAAPG